MQTEVIEEMETEAIEGFRLSPQQRHLWALQRGEQQTAFSMRCAVEIEGQLNSEILKAALQDILLSNEILRTTFQQIPGESWPYQVVGSDAQLSLYDIDLSELDCDEQKARLESLFEDAAHPLTGMPDSATINVRLATLSPSSHVLFISLPSLCADKATFKNLLSEITRIYDSLLKGEPTGNDPIQYIDLAEWQNDLLESEETNLGTMFWKDNIGGSLYLTIPPYFRKPAGDNSGFEPVSSAFVVDAALAHEIKALALERDVSVAAYLLACWQVLFSRLSGQTSILTGVAFDGRRSQEVETALGLFARHLPIKADFEEDPTFDEALMSAHAALSEAHKRQEYFSFEQLPDGASQISPFFPLCFEYEKQPAKYLTQDATFTITKQRGHFDKFALKLTCLEGEESLQVQLHYDPDILEVRDVERIAGQFDVLLRSACAHPETRVSRLSMLSEVERERLFRQSGESNISYRVDECFHQSFERQAELRPHNIAVVLGDRRLSYGELNTRANQLAHYLCRQGVGPEVRVGMYLDPSLEMLVGILGILKAGGAYVPINPAYPKQRVAFMLENSNASILLCQQALVADVAGASSTVICLDSDWETIATESEENIVSGVCTENLAYVIYTSGSTGQPKGVQITHANVGRLFKSTAEQFQFDEQDTWMLFHSYAFDFSVWEIGGALLHGGRLIIVPSALAREPEAIRELLESEKVTVLNQTPSAFRQLIQADMNAAAPGAMALRLVIFGGEALNLSELKPWFERHGERKPLLVNMYGITETTVHVTWRALRSSDLKGLDRSPVGRPLSDLQTYVLDSQMKPVPSGVVGELYVGGAGLARGYLDQPELTATKFLPNPLSHVSGDRLYRSGDRVRLLDDGGLDYLGRMDEQVKIRGYRIELGEIEAAMCRHHAVEEAVVVLDENEMGDKRLVGYFTPARESSDSADVIREFLRESLPEYMVPGLFVRLATIPLTLNGKINKKALPALNTSRPELAAPYLAPRTPLEKELAEVWAASLGLERVGVNDHFFDLGGHSLIATQIVYGMRETYQTEVPLTFFFTSVPTIAVLAASIEQQQIEEAEEEGLSAELEALDALSDEEVRALLGNA